MHDHSAALPERKAAFGFRLPLGHARRSQHRPVWFASGCPRGAAGRDRIAAIWHCDGGKAAVMSESTLLSRLRRSEEHTSELQSLMRSSYAVFCLKKKKIIHITIFIS